MTGGLLQPIPLFESLSKDAKNYIINRLRMEMFSPTICWYS